MFYSNLTEQTQRINVAVAMWTLPLTTLQKSGIITYELIAGLSTIVVTAFSAAFLGLCISLFAQYTGLIHLGEYGPWLPIIGAEYGLLPGGVIGVVVCWKVCKSRLRDTAP